MTPPTPAKPREGEPCNGCGLCCRMEVCAIGLRIHGRHQQAPCPSLVYRDGRTWCGAVLAERWGVQRGVLQTDLVAQVLGIGTSCDSADFAEGDGGKA